MSVTINPWIAGAPGPSTDPLLGQGVPYIALNGNGTYVLKTGSGTLYGCSVTAPGVLSTFKAYDGVTTGGQVLVGSLSTVALGPLNMGMPSGYAMEFSDGLTIVLAGTTAPTLLVFFR